MIRVIYDGNRMLSGNLECSFCGRNDIKLPGNVQIVVRNGVTRTHPNARGVVYNHFHDDRNAHIDICSGRPEIGETHWEAINAETGSVLARGRVELLLNGKALGPIRVYQDEPTEE